MPDFDCCAFHYDAAKKILAVRVTGAVTDDSVTACYANAARYFKSREVHGAIIDLSGIGPLEVSAAGIRKLSSLEPLLADPAVRYVIAPQNHIFGMARMFQLASPKGREKLHVVRTLSAAHKAMGVIPQQFERLPTLP